MSRNLLSLFSLGGLMLAALTTPALSQEPPSREEMWRTVQEQQKQIRALTERLERTTEKVETTEKKVEVTKERSEATGAMVEQVREASSAQPG